MSKLNRLVAIALAALLITSAGTAFAATPSIDEETSDTSTESDIVSAGTTEITGFNANESNTTYVEVSFDSTPSGDAKMAIVDPTTADKKKNMETVYANSSAEETNATSNNYAWNISHDELSDVPVSPSTKTKFFLKTWDTEDTSNATYTTFYITATADYSVIRIGNSFAESDDVTIEDANPWLGRVLSSYDVDRATIETDDLNTTSNTTHSVVLSNSSVSDSFSSAAEDSEDGTWLTAVTVTAEGDDGDVLIPVFLNSKTEEWDFLDDDEAYAVYDSDTGKLDVHLAGDERFEDADETTLTVTSNDEIGIRNGATMLSNLGAGTGTSYWTSINAQVV
jgi:hypothetical protein